MLQIGKKRYRLNLVTIGVWLVVILILLAGRGFVAAEIAETTEASPEAAISSLQEPRPEAGYAVRVDTGDTVWSLAEQYLDEHPNEEREIRLLVDEIIDHNELAHASAIQPSQVIFIPHH